VFFAWTDKAKRAFELIKEKLNNAPILAFPNFDKVLKLECILAEWHWSSILTRKETYCLSQ